MKLKPAIKTAWLEDLRSGRFLQGRRVLRQKTPTGDKLCCLGVLCEQAVKAGVILPPVLDEGNDAYMYGAEGAEGVLPGEVARWASLEASSVVSNPMIGRIALSEWNDHHGADFNKIADLIEERL